MTKHCRISIIVAYTPAKWTDGDSIDSDEFYLPLQEQIDQVSGRYMAFLFEDFGTQVS